MKFSVVAIFLFLPFFGGAQNTLEITPPYNPDSDVNGNIGITDLMQLLAGFGEDFTPEAILVDGDLELGLLLGTLIATIETLQEQVAALEAQVVPGLADYISVDTELNMVQFNGANVAIRNGLGNTSWNNGLGNLWLGYNEVNLQSPPPQTGSHNIMLGSNNSFPGNSNLIIGQSNQAVGFEGIVHGTNNSNSGGRSCIVGGNNSLVTGEMNVVVGGQQNVGDGSSSVVVGGLLNETFEFNAVAMGGYDNVAAGLNSTVVGGHSHLALGHRTSIFGGAHNATHVDAQSDGSAVFGGQYNTVIDGIVVGGRNNFSRGEDNVILGGSGNQIMQDINSETGDGEYNRWSVMLGGTNNTLPSSTPDYRVLLGELNGVFISTTDTTNVITP